MSEETNKAQANEIEEAEVNQVVETVEIPTNEETTIEAAEETATVVEETATVVEETEAVVEETATVVEETPTARKTSSKPQDENVDDIEDEELDLTIGEDIPLDDQGEFDWEAYEYGVRGVSKADRETMVKMYEDTLSSSVEHQVVNGKIVAKSDREIIIDINSKSEGVVSLNEFRYNPDLKIGDSVEVLVDKQEDKNGQLVLSHRKARSIQAWDRVNSAFEADEIVTGFVKCRTKGGMIVDVYGLEAFLPGSQIDVKPIRDYDVYVEKTMEFKIVKINHEFKNVVVSHKALIEADLEEQKREIIGKLEKGQVLEGVVKNITSYGVFIDLGGVDGLVHITDLSWSRINHPTEIVELDQKLNVVILDFDEDKSRIQLGLKQLEAHPWEKLNADLKVGDKVTGKVVVLADYGAFVEVQPGVEGLIHVSEMSWSTHLRSAQDFMKVGDDVQALVLTLDREERKMSLGIKQLTPDPWIDITTKYALGSQHTGTVRNFTNFGVFVEMEEGIDGLIHISDLSWTKKIKHPSEFTAVGSTLQVVVLEIDTENRRLSLGHKQLDENPWDNYEAVFEVGSQHTGTVTEVNDKGCDVYFETFGVEGFCPARHMMKDGGGKLVKGDVVEFKVLEFSKDNKRILVSHTQLHKDAVAEEKASSKAKAEGEAVNTAAAVKKIQGNVERSTLGDLDGLAELKAKMEEDEKA
jgi:small subunit ribosomal protein S1